MSVRDGTEEKWTERRLFRRRLLGLTGGAALVLAVVAGIGVWQTSREGGAATISTSFQTVAVAPTSLTAVAPTADMTTVYLVGSEAEAARITNYWAALSAVGGAAPQVSELVLTIRSAEEEAAVKGFPEYAYPGAGSVRVVDLRRP